MIFGQCCPTMKGCARMDFTPLREFMEHLTAWRIPGNAISVYRGGQCVFQYASGFSDVEQRIPMTGRELISLYSCSKVATVTAALQLYEKSYFRLDTPLWEFLPAYRHMTVAGEDGTLHPAKSDITMEQLFCHTSGLSYDLNAPALQALRQQMPAMPTVAAASALAREPLLFEPGTRWSYSLSHDVLAAVVEVISGIPFSQYVKAHIFAPLGVTEVYYHTDAALQSRMAQQYLYQTGSTASAVQLQISSGEQEGSLTNFGKGNEFILGAAYDSGGAGIVTTVDSYAKFAGALSMGGRTPEGTAILQPETVALMQQNRLTDRQRQDFGWSQHSGYGYGLGVRCHPRRDFGWSGAAGATLLADSHQEFALVYAHHMRNPQEDYYLPRLCQAAYVCL